MTYLACPLLLICVGLPAFPAGAEQALAQPELAEETEAEDSQDAARKFTVDGTTLIYDTETDAALEISNGDVDALRDLLRDNDGITTLRLNSGGGSVWAAKEMARIAIDFELDTEVDGECSSSCVRIFLGGDRRSMLRGSKIGFHSRSWSAGAVERYYDKWHEDEGWDTPFEFASWIYRDTWAEAYEDLTWSISRGVKAEFAVEMHAPRDTMWFPPRAALHDGGILRE
ncbi:MAG: hypothetical protein R3D85_09050 [Paracoccaceae bacterium]